METQIMHAAGAPGMGSELSRAGGRGQSAGGHGVQWRARRSPLLTVRPCAQASNMDSPIRVGWHVLDRHGWRRGAAAHPAAAGGHHR